LTGKWAIAPTDQLPFTGTFRLAALSAWLSLAADISVSARINHRINGGLSRDAELATVNLAAAAAAAANAGW